MYKEVAKKIILSYLNQNLDFEWIQTIYEINSDNDEILLEHIKYIRNIFDKAIKEIEGEKSE